MILYGIDFISAQFFFWQILKPLSQLDIMHQIGSEI